MSEPPKTQTSIRSLTSGTRSGTRRTRHSFRPSSPDCAHSRIFETGSAPASPRFVSSVLPALRWASAGSRATSYYQLWVSALARGSGAAVALIDDAEHRLSAGGVDTAWLGCAIGNERAARFYEKRGWQRTGIVMDPVETSEGPFPLNVWRYDKALKRRNRAREPPRSRQRPTSRSRSPAGRSTRPERAARRSSASRSATSPAIEARSDLTPADPVFLARAWATFAEAAAREARRRARNRTCRRRRARPDRARDQRGRISRGISGQGADRSERGTRRTPRHRSPCVPGGAPDVRHRDLPRGLAISRDRPLGRAARRAGRVSSALPRSGARLLSAHDLRRSRQHVSREGRAVPRGREHVLLRDRQLREPRLADAPRRSSAPTARCSLSAVRRGRRC